jgi:hypothetical protein
MLDCLLRRQDLDESAAECIERIGVVNVPVQTDGVELGHHENAVQPRMNAVGNRDVDQPILARNRDGRLAP